MKASVVKASEDEGVAISEWIRQAIIERLSHKGIYDSERLRLRKEEMLKVFDDEAFKEEFMKKLNES